MKSRLILFASALFLLHCSRPTQAIRESPARQIDPQPNDIARFLAGLPGRADGPFHTLEATPAWRQHKQTFDRMWSKFEQNRLPAMRTFQEKEIAGAAFAGEFVFYPFGGPDTLTVTTLFPQRGNYVLIGLEPPGTLPSEDQILEANLERQLPRMERTLESLLHRSFFITASMDHQVRGQITDGLLPVMLVQLARCGYTILSHQSVTLNDTGELHPRTNGTKRNRGVRIDFQSPTGQHGRIVYLSANLNNTGLAENDALQKFIARSAPSVAFFKSSSYMPHRPEFSTLRKLVLDHCRAIVQDDSGIPYRFVNHSQWNVRLYGRYTQPYGSFRGLVQPDLRKAYQQNAAPLGFSIGYGFGRAPSALQIFSRKS